MIETISDATTIIVNVNYFLTSQKLVRHITEVDAPPTGQTTIDWPDNQRWLLMAEFHRNNSATPAWTLVVAHHCVRD